jgi:hypothetical protein
MPSFDVTFYAHTGLNYRILDGASRDEAAERVKRRNRYYRKRGFAVSKVGKNRWEYEDEDCVMMGDDQGVLVVKLAKRRRRR